MSQQLDRGKPLWEMWVVEGLEDDRFALITKAHHCMIDGVGSVELTGSVMRPTPDPDPRLDEPAPRWLPRPAPGPRSCSRRELGTGTRRAASARPIARATRSPTRARRLRVGARRSSPGSAEALGAGLPSGVADAAQRARSGRTGASTGPACDLARVQARQARASAAR